MQNADLLAERERRSVRKRSTAIQRAIATIELALSDLAPLDRTLVLLKALEEDNQIHRERSKRASLGA
jgi:hypothetical protein